MGGVWVLPPIGQACVHTPVASDLEMGGGKERCLEVFPDGFPGGQALQALVGQGVAVEVAVVAHDVDHRQPVLAADGKVGGVVPRGDLEAPRAELGVHLAAADDGDAPAVAIASP